MPTVNIRGHKITVRAVSGSQLAFIKKQLQERTDEQLAAIADPVYQNSWDSRVVELSGIIEQLIPIFDRLTEILDQKTDEVEEEVARLGGPFDDYVTQEDGTERGIIFWEHVSPSLDAARGSIDMAICQLGEAIRDEQE